ncbi:hypothetical protein JYU34_010257 [Plutella xylostella]|uniref:Regulatory protein zeste n=2 Tax=Plutella xylostella TaxID=51655 RepID=A0ABQ7QII4_PLUXY|nr:hypothetical protein JYU34_010257 [Plutella xylostella]
MCKGSPRKLAQLKTQWTGQKMDEKKKKGNVRREMLKTGGGPPPPSEQCDPDDIESWLPHEFTVDTCEGDSDFLHQYETVQVNILDEHAITTTDAIEEVPLATSAPTEAVEIVAAASTPLKKRKKIIKKQKNNDDAAGLPATLIANNEIKCRQELHAKQMKNEDLKYEVLLLEKELLKHKIEFYKSKTNK